MGQCCQDEKKAAGRPGILVQAAKKEASLSFVGLREGMKQDLLLYVWRQATTLEVVGLYISSNFDFVVLSPTYGDLGTQGNHQNTNPIVQSKDVLNAICKW